MRRHNYRLWKLGIFSMLIVVCMMVLGYSLLSTSLQVNASTAQSAMTWNIGFNTTYEVTPLSLASSSVTCGTPTITSTTATLSTIHLSAAGDGCRYKLPVANTGDINGQLSNVVTSVVSNSSSYTCTQVSSGKVLSCTYSGDSSEILIFPSANASITATTLGTSSAATIASNYVQPLINSVLNAGNTSNVYLYVFLRETPSRTSFSGLRFQTVVTYSQY